MTPFQQKLADVRKCWDEEGIIFDTDATILLTACESMRTALVEIVEVRVSADARYFAKEALAQLERLVKESK